MNREEQFSHRVVETLIEQGPMLLLDIVLCMLPLGVVRITPQGMGPVAEALVGLIDDGVVGQCLDDDGDELYFVKL